MIIVAHPTQRRANSRMDVAVIGQQSLLMCVVEICTVVDSSLFARSAAKDLWAPGIKVGIEMNDADGTVGFGYGAEQRKGDCVVTTQSDDARKGFAFL